MAADQEIVLSNLHGPFKRGLLIAAGLFLLIVPIWDLWPALTALTAATIYVAPIVFGRVLLAR